MYHIYIYIYIEIGFKADNSRAINAVYFISLAKVKKEQWKFSKQFFNKYLFRFF